jgi:transketolase
MRALPNMTVLCPADSIEVEQMMDFMLDWPGPVYVRINRNDLPFVYPVGEPYHIGQVIKIRDGKDAAIFGSGIMVSKALEAATILEKEGISARVLDISTIKPLDREAVIRYASGVDAIVTAEEHSIIGGVGSAVVEALRAVSHAPVEFVGVPDSFGTSTQNYDQLLDYFHLTPDGIATAVKSLLKGKMTCASVL